VAAVWLDFAERHVAMISTFCNCRHAAQFVVFSPSNDTTPCFLHRPTSCIVIKVIRSVPLSQSSDSSGLPAGPYPYRYLRFGSQFHVPTVRTGVILFQKPSSELTAISRTLVYAWTFPGDSRQTDPNTPEHPM